MPFTQRFTEYSALLISENNPVLAVGVYDTGWVSLQNYHRAVAIMNVINMGVGGTVDMDIRQATTTAGAGAKAIAGKSLTALTQAGGDVDSDCAIELRTEELDVTNVFDCVSLRVTVAGAPAVVSYRLYGLIPRFPPVSTAAWTEVVG